MRERCLDARRDRLEQRPQPLDDRGLAADHQAVAALEAPDAAARADVEVVDPFLAERGGARDVVAVVGVAAVDDHVAGLQPLAQVAHGLLGDLAGRDHHPDGPRLVKLLDELVERAGAGRTLRLELLDRPRVDVEDDALVTGGQEPADEVRAHPSEPDHPQLHSLPSRLARLGVA